MLEGIDVSKWQPRTPGLTGLGFAFARATYATSPDERYAQHTAAFRAADIAAGAYHFGTGFVAVPRQVEAFLETAGDADLLALDWETDRAKTMTRAQAREFIAAVQATGRRIGLYASRSWFRDLGQDWHWVAQWGPRAPDRPWHFWQYQGSPLDRNRFNGDRAALARLIGRPQEGADMQFIAAAGFDIRSSKRLRVGVGTTILTLDGRAKLAGPLTAPAELVLIGNGDASSAARVVLVNTGNPYTDKVVRPTFGLVKGGQVIDAPSGGDRLAGLIDAALGNLQAAKAALR